MVWLQARCSWQSPEVGRSKRTLPHRLLGIRASAHFIYIFFSETVSQYVVLTVPEFMAIFLPQLHKDWNYRCEPPYLAQLRISVLSVVREHSSVVSPAWVICHSSSRAGQSKVKKLPNDLISHSNHCGWDLGYFILRLCGFLSDLVFFKMQFY